MGALMANYGDSANCVLCRFLGQKKMENTQVLISHKYQDSASHVLCRFLKQGKMDRMQVLAIQGPGVPVRAVRSKVRQMHEMNT
jgi:hypothetical protein